MKIIQINNCYPYGSTGKIVKDIHNYLTNNNIDSLVCYGNGKKNKKKNVYKFSNFFLQKTNALISRITGIMYGGCFLSTSKLINIIKKEKPNVVHIHCINGHTVNIYKLINWLNKNDINTVITLHAEFMYTGNCGHSLECEKWKTGCGKCPRLKKETKSFLFDNTHKSWLKMYNAFHNFKNIKIVSVSHWLMQRALESPVLNSLEHCTILNGLDIDTFKIYDTEKLKKKMGLENKKIIFHATPQFSGNINHIKGGYYLIELAKKLLGSNIQIIVAGEYENVSVPNNITFLGKITEQKMLARYYSMADLFVLTSKKETFSMTTAESLCCGTPVVGFMAGGPEQIALNDYSSFVENGNVEALYDIIMKWINIKEHKKNVQISKSAHKKYSRENMAKKYINIYNSFYN